MEKTENFMLALSRACSLLSVMRMEEYVEKARFPRQRPGCGCEAGEGRKKRSLKVGMRKQTPIQNGEVIGAQGGTSVYSRKTQVAGVTLYASASASKKEDKEGLRRA